MRELFVLPLLVASMLAGLPRGGTNPAALSTSLRPPWSAPVSDHIVRHPTLSTIETCGSWVACSRVIANAARECQSEPGTAFFQANPTLRLYGTIHYFNGPLTSGKRPLDRSVVNGPTAITHEYRRHIAPAVEAVVPLITQLQSARFTSSEQCESSAGEASAAIMATFRAALAATQEDELAGMVR